jgi:hypothetical protein
MCCFNRRDKVEINFIKNSCESHMLLKNGTHVTFINKVEGNSSNLVYVKKYKYRDFLKNKKIQNSHS